MVCEHCPAEWITGSGVVLYCSGVLVKGSSLHVYRYGCMCIYAWVWMDARAFFGALESSPA